MGWSSGSRLFGEMIDAIKSDISDVDVREDLYRKLIEIFQDYDCDTLDECYGEDPCFDEVWDQLYPRDEE